MIRIYKNLILGVSLLVILSCTNNFKEINTNPNQPDIIEPSLLFSRVLNRAASERYDQWRGNLIYCSMWAQHLSGQWETDRYITANEDWLSAWWNNSYQEVGKNLFQVVENTDENSELHAMALIFKVFYFQRLTDMYGAIPYREAAQGALFTQPSYDQQEVIYDLFVDDLRKAIGILANGQNTVSSADIIYNGDPLKWKKWAASLMLRIAIRMSEVNEGNGMMLANEALEHGVFESNDDIAYISFSGTDIDGANANGVGEVFQDFGVTGHQFRYSDEFVNLIINNDDPRESTLIETYKADGSIDNTVGAGNHLGRPNGIDPGTDDFVFAQPRRDVMVTYDAPAIYMSFAEVEFLIAEAAVRSWVGNNYVARDRYESGVRAACEHLQLYPNAPQISNNDIEKYLEESRIEFDESKAIEQINTQKWIALIFDGFEAYANLRRSGYPDVTPGLSAGESNGEIPKRLRYPIDERVNNGESYTAALQYLSNGDVITSPLWWDK